MIARAPVLPKALHIFWFVCLVSQETSSELEEVCLTKAYFARVMRCEITIPLDMILEHDRRMSGRLIVSEDIGDGLRYIY